VNGALRELLGSLVTRLGWVESEQAMRGRN
jgi:hypothetical protein